MTDRPIIYNGSMVRALLDGRKTQTRRLAWSFVRANVICWRPSPWQNATLGDRLWVRESGRTLSAATCHDPVLQRDVFEIMGFLHTADGARVPYLGRDPLHDIDSEKSIPSIHMPRWASRLTLVVSEVRFERLQDITEADAQAEGVEDPMAEREDHDWSICPQCGGTGLYNGLGQNLGVMFDCDCLECDTHEKRFRHLWESLHGTGSWDANPELVALTFTVHRVNIDQMPGRDMTFKDGIKEEA